MINYYTDTYRMRVWRFENGTAETYHFPLRKWVFDQDFYDMLIGELWVDEISENEALEIIASRSKKH